MDAHNANRFAPEACPSERLRQSRNALLVQLGRAPEAKQPDEPSSSTQNGHPAPASPSGCSDWWGLLKRAVRGWWRRHPVRAVSDIAAPVLSLYAREKPLKVLGIAAAVGAAVVVLRPWRLLSAGALLAAAVRPADLSGLLLSLISEPSNHRSDQRNNDPGPIG